ncbi:transposase [Lysinibacillus yapensis]|uniref:Transposase n=1 Tax=Ureibacillus yapensis TaxID=2304605 RepID=A0A396S3T3_9BACL|nr:transposase [Lysinibacillus yapensis]
MIDTTIYVNVANQSYSYIPLGEPCEFKLKMDEEKARIFELLFLQLNSLEFDNIVRAHLPYIPYHLDETNDEIDTRLKKIYALIHEFGDNHTKQFVAQLPYFH